MKARDYLIVAASVVAVFLAGAAVVNQLIFVAVDEHYSPGYHSESARHARERGVLLATVAAPQPEFEWGRARYRVREAWVEDAVQTRYRLLFFSRDSLLDTPTSVVRVADDSTAPLCVALGGHELRYDGVHALGGNDCERWRWYVAVQQPFPDSVSLSVAVRASRAKR